MDGCMAKKGIALIYTLRKSAAIVFAQTFRFLLIRNPNSRVCSLRNDIPLYLDCPQNRRANLFMMMTP